MLAGASPSFFPGKDIPRQLGWSGLGSQAPPSRTWGARAGGRATVAGGSEQPLKRGTWGPCLSPGKSVSWLLSEEPSSPGGQRLRGQCDNCTARLLLSAVSRKTMARAVQGFAVRPLSRPSRGAEFGSTPHGRRGCHLVGPPCLRGRAARRCRSCLLHGLEEIPCLLSLTGPALTLRLEAGAARPPTLGHGEAPQAPARCPGCLSPAHPGSKPGAGV